MGCTASKLDNEDTVRRCKDRRRLIQAAVTARHHLAAAHSDYCRSLRLTGSSLSTFAQGEPLPVSPQTPSILLTTPTTATSPLPKLPKYHQTNYANTPQSSFSSHSRKPSNLAPNYVNTPQSHSRSSSNLPPNFTSKQNNAAPPPPVATSAPRRYQKPNTMKLPHILSDSSFSSSPPHDFTYKASSNYQNTPSQTSSVWNWENFYPPSPPDSEFYENDHKHKDAEYDKASVRSEHFRKEDDRDKASVYSDFFDKSSVQSERFRTRKEDDRDKASVYSVKSERFRSVKHEEDDKDGASVYSDFFDRRKPEHHLDTEEGETEREEVQYSEWDDHYNTTSSSSSEGEDRVSPRSEIRSNYAASVRADPRAEVEVPKYEESLYGDGGSIGENEISNDMRMVVRHKDLAEIVAAIREYFDKAASAGEQVGEMLETGRAQLDRSFSKLKKTVYHSSGVFSNLSSSWTSKPPLAVKYRMEQSSIVEPGGPKSLCSTLERLLAWEKKLYQEVKAREGVKIEHEKKLASLQSQEYRGGNEAKLDKTKTEINRLQSLIVVTSQAVSTTSSAIIGVRDAELVPQLVELCHGFMYMWRSMNQFHEVQNQIVQQVRGLVNRTTKGESTSDLHRQATRDLESAVSAWHSSFCRLIKFQRDFIRSLHGWYKLTLVPLDNETINKNIDNNEAFSFYDEWKLALDQLPDTVASEAIKSFINVVHSISMKQTEELKIKKRTETASARPGASKSPTIEITDYSLPATATSTDELKDVLKLEDTSLSAAPDVRIPGPSTTDAKTRNCSQSLLPESHVIERLKEQLYLETSAKDISIFQLKEQSELQLDLHQENQQLLHEASSAANLVSEVQHRNESLCEELAKCKSDLELAVDGNDDMEKQFYAAKSEVMEISTIAEGLRIELERSHEVSSKQLAEIAEYKNLVDTLRAEIDTLNGSVATSVDETNKIAEEKVLLEQENEKLSTALVECKDSLKSLQLENIKLNDSLVLTSEEGRNHQEANEIIALEKEKLLTQLAGCRAILEVLQADNDKLNGKLLLAEEDRKELVEEKSHFSTEREKLSLELADSKDLLASLQLEHCKALDELREANSRLQQLSSDNIRVSLPRDGQADISSSQVEYPEQYFGLVNIKEHLEAADSITQLLLNTIEEIHSHSMLMIKSSEKGVAPAVSKLIQAFESKGHHEDYDELEASSTEGKLHKERFLLAKEQTSRLRTVFNELLRDSNSAIEFLRAQKDKHLADASLHERKVSFEALKEYYDNCEAASIETVVVYEYVKRHLSDIEVQKLELLALYDTTRQQNIILEAEKNELVSELGVSQSRMVELERNIDEIRSSSDELVFSLSSKVDSLSKEAGERELKHEQVIKSVRKLGEFVGSPCSTLESVHDDAQDLVSFVAMSIDATISCIENMQEKIEACKIDKEMFTDVVEKCKSLDEKNELAVGVLHHLQSKLKKLVTTSSGLEAKSQVIEESENPEVPLHLDNYDTLMEELSVLLNGRLQLESENSKLRLELNDKENQVEELTKKSFDSDAILHLVEDVEHTIKIEAAGFNSDKLEARLHYLISFLFQKYKELSWSKEASMSREMESNLLQGQIESLSLMVTEYENEIVILKESLMQGREAFVALQAELQGKVNELEQSEQRVSSIREKLSIAVSKGKGLIVQRDNLKQSLAETSSELEKYLKELQVKDSMLEEVETKLKAYSEAGERMEALESELSYIRNSATALRESFLLKDSVLQRIEEILEDLELPENFHSRDIIEKVDWLARSVTGNALPLTDWDQKSSGGEALYPDAGSVATDAWKEDMQQNDSSDDDLRKQYEQLQSKFYGLAEQNDMLEQSLMERNNLVQRWEEIIDRVNMPLQLRSVEPEDRIEWLVKAFSEAHHRCGSLQQKFDHLDTYCEAITADLEQSQMRLADLDTALQAVASEKEQLVQKLDSSTSKYERALKVVGELEFENDKLQNEVTTLQEKLSVEVENYEIVNHRLQDEVAVLRENISEEDRKYRIIEDEIQRLEDLISGVLQGSTAGETFSSGRGFEYLEQLLQKLIEQYTTLSLEKSIVSEAGEQIKQNAGPIIIENREKEDAEENLATASREELDETLHALTNVKEERDKYMEINQSLAHQVEQLELKKQELQQVVSQEEQKSASLREKLNVAVRKGKSLVQHRDSLKQAIEEMNIEVERLKSEMKVLQANEFEYAEKIKDLSAYKERVELMESETSGLKKQLSETEYFLQEKTHTLSIIQDTLNSFDASFNNINDPFEKLNQIAKRWHDLHAVMTSSETKISKAQRSAELLLAELNEVQERNDVLQEELAEARSELSELSRERDLAEASKHKAISQFEELSSLQDNERNNQLDELMSVKSCLTELTLSFYSIIDLIANVLSKEGECLYNLEMSMTSSLEPSSANVHGQSVGYIHSILPTLLENRGRFFSQNSLLESEMQECIDHSRPTDACSLLGSRLQVFVQEIDFLKESIQKHSLTLEERVENLSQVAGAVCREMTSHKHSLGSMTEKSVQLENIEKERDDERVAMRKNISLLFEACKSAVRDIENWKFQSEGSNLVAEDLQELFDSSIDYLSSEECNRTMADKLLSVVRDFIRSQNEIVESSQKDMKVTIGNLQKELQEKDIQKDRICVELVNQIRQAESLARNHLQDSESAKAQLEDVTKHLELMEEECNMLKQRIEELENAQSTLEELDERARSLNSILAAKDQEIEALMQALDEEESQMEDLTNKISELERAVQQKNSDLENLQASRAKAMKKLSITVSKFDELHHLSASLLSEVEKLQMQVHERDEEISFLRQEVTRSTNDALQASQMSNKRNSNEMYDLVTWLNSVNSMAQVDIEGMDDLSSDQAKDYKEMLQKQIGALLSELEDLKAVVHSKDTMLQVEKTKVEDLMRKGESLEATLREKDSQLSMHPLEISRPMRSSISEIVEAEPLMNKWSPTGTSAAPQVRSLRKVNNDQVAISIDTDTATQDRLDDEDDDKAHGFKSLTTSRIVPRFTRPVTDMVDGLWVSCDRMLMRQPALRLGVIMYWALMHALLATFVV